VHTITAVLFYQVLKKQGIRKGLKPVTALSDYLAISSKKKDIFNMEKLEKALAQVKGFATKVSFF